MKLVLQAFILKWNLAWPKKVFSLAVIYKTTK